MTLKKWLEKRYVKNLDWKISMKQEIISLKKESKMNWSVESRKKVFTTVNYIEHFLTLACNVTRCISISTFTSLLGVPIGITSSAIKLNICWKAAETKKY